MTKRYTIALVPGYSGIDHLFDELTGWCADSYSSKIGATRGFYRGFRRWNRARRDSGLPGCMPPSVKAVPFQP